MIQPWDTMSLIKADLGSVCVASGPVWVDSKHPNRATLYPLYASLCTGEQTRSESINAFSAVLSTEGRVVGLCWEKFKPQCPKGCGSENGQSSEFLQ